MALLTYEAELERSGPEQPFSNGFEGENWMDRWCENGCVFLDDCSLLTVVMVDGRMPAPWKLRRPGTLNPYDCAEFSLEDPA